MHETELSEFYLDQLLAALTTPLGLFGLFGLLVLLAAVVTIPAMRWVCVAGLIYIATIPLTAGANIQYARLAPPLEQFRAVGRPLIYLFLTLLMMPLLQSQRGWRNRLVTLPLLMFFAFELLISTRLMVFGNFVRGSFSIISYGLIMLALGLGLSRWLQSMEDLYKLVWALSIAGGLVVLGTAYQLAVNRSLIITNSRLVGVTGNPQFFGIIIAYTMPFTCHLLTRPAGRKWIRPLLVVQVAVMVVMLVWTGSRTGALSTSLGLIVLFHRRLGRFAVMAVVVAAAVYLALPFFDGSTNIASRLIWTTNTRASVWANMYVNFRSSPLFGVSSDVYETAESSYLAMLSQFGIIGSLPCFIAIGLLLRQLLRLYRLRSRLGPERGLVDLALAVWTTIGVSSVFEGLLMGVITFPVLTIYAQCALTAFVLDWAETDQTYALAPAPAFAAAA